MSMQNQVNFTFNQLLNYFISVYGDGNYANYIKSIDKHNGGQTAKWVNEVILNNTKKNRTPDSGTLSEALSKFDGFFNTYSPKPPQKKLSEHAIISYRSGYIKFIEVVLGFFSANTWLSRGRSHETSKFLCQLVADNAIFASCSVVQKVKDGKLGSKDNIVNGGNRFASWDFMLHVRCTSDIKGNKKDGNEDITKRVKGEYPTIRDKVIADDNTIANLAFKKAIIHSFQDKLQGLKLSNVNLFKDYEVCHIWDLPGDRRYYASIANLVLLPRAIAALSDHSDEVKSLLRNKAFERFQFVPDGEKVPDPPSFYKTIKWRYSF